MLAGAGALRPVGANIAAPAVRPDAATLPRLANNNPDTAQTRPSILNQDRRELVFTLPPIFGAFTFAQEGRSVQCLRHMKKIVVDEDGEVGRY